MQPSLQTKPWPKVKQMVIIISSSCIPHYVDQLISGQEYGGIQKEGLTPGHQRANRQHGELITGTINSDTTNTAAANSANFSINVTVNVTGINQSTALQ